MFSYDLMTCFDASLPSLPSPPPALPSGHHSPVQVHGQVTGTSLAAAKGFVLGLILSPAPPQAHQGPGPPCLPWDSGHRCLPDQEVLPGETAG